jgi:hypothetical protein
MDNNQTKKTTGQVTKQDISKLQQASTVNSKSKGLPLPIIIAIGCVGVLVVSGIIMTIVTRFFLKNVGTALLQKGIENSIGIRVDTKMENGEVSFTDSKTGSKIDLGAKKIPDNFPSDFPIYPKAIPEGSMSGGQQTNKGFWLMLKTPDEFEKVDNFYATKLASSGWGGSEILRVGNSVTYKISKGTLEGTTMVSRENDEKQTSILILLGTRGQETNVGRNNGTNIEPTIEITPEQ